MSSDTSSTAKAPVYKTKLQKILAERGLNQKQFRELIEKETGEEIGADRMSIYVNGGFNNIMLSTIKTMAKALKVEPGELID